VLWVALFYELQGRRLGEFRGVQLSETVESRTGVPLRRSRRAFHDHVRACEPRRRGAAGTVISAKETGVGPTRGCSKAVDGQNWEVLLRLRGLCSVLHYSTNCKGNLSAKSREGSRRRRRRAGLVCRCGVHVGLSRSRSGLRTSETRGAGTVITAKETGVGPTRRGRRSRTGKTGKCFSG
jgi:hypothetical protein